jgi:hypothetical protein
LHAGFLLLHLGQGLFQLGNILTRGVELLLGLCAFVGIGRAEQARQGNEYQGAKHGAGDTKEGDGPSMPAADGKKNA